MGVKYGASVKRKEFETLHLKFLKHVLRVNEKLLQIVISTRNLTFYHSKLEEFLSLLNTFKDPFARQ